MQRSMKGGSGLIDYYPWLLSREGGSVDEAGIPLPVENLGQTRAVDPSGGPVRGWSFGTQQAVRSDGLTPLSWREVDRGWSHKLSQGMHLPADGQVPTPRRNAAGNCECAWGLRDGAARHLCHAASKEGSVLPSRSTLESGRLTDGEPVLVSDAKPDLKASFRRSASQALQPA